MSARKMALGLTLACIISHGNLSLAENSPLDYASRPYNSGNWLWEPVTRLLPESSGAALGSRDEQGQELVIQPGGTALLRLPRGYWLHLSARGKSTKGEHPGVRSAPLLWRSQGNGLFIPARPQQGMHENDWLLPPLERSDEYVLVENNSSANQSWWLSRITADRADEVYPYRDNVDGGNEDNSWAYQLRQGKHLQVTPLQTGEDYSVVLQGPGEWRLEARTIVNGRQPWQRFIDLPVRLNNAFWRDWRLHPRTDHDELLELGQCKSLASTPESLYITLPAGEHTISFTAPQAMAVRALALRQDDYLFDRNQPKPASAELFAHFRLNNAPSAQAGYDEQVFASLLADNYALALPTPYMEQLEPGLAPIGDAARLFEQRYRFWRELPVANEGQAPGQAALIEITAATPGKGRHRYIYQPDSLPARTAPLLRLAPDQVITLDAPDQRQITNLKLSLAASKTPFDLILTNRLGKKTVWRWRPGLMQREAMDLASDNDLVFLAGAQAQSSLAAAAYALDIFAEEFPVKLSHSGSQAISFSAYYRDNAHWLLDQTGWTNALQELGPDQMLDLLVTEERPLQTSAVDPLQQLQAKVWDDWEPLRQWLHSNQQTWTRGVESSSTTESPFRPGQVSLLIGKLGSEPDAGYLLEQLFEGMAIRDPDRANREQALRWLYTHFQEAQDRTNLSAYHSWSFRYAPMQQLQALADWLVTVKLDDMAARLYYLAGTSPSHLPFLQASLGAGWHTVDSPPTPLSSMARALWMQDWNAARRYAQRLDHDNPWRAYLESTPADGRPQSWLAWAQQAPGVEIDGEPATTPLHISSHQNAGILNFYSSGRELHLQRALATPDTPVRYTVTGPVELQLTLNLLHTDPTAILDDWIEISANGQTQWFPIIESRVSPTLIALPQPTAASIGVPRQLKLSLGAGKFDIDIRPRTIHAVVNAEMRSPLLLGPLLESVQETDQEVPENSYTVAELVDQLDIVELDHCEVIASWDNQAEKPGAARGVDYPGPIPAGTQWKASPALSGIYTSEPDATSKPDDLEQFLLQLLWHWPQTGDSQRRQLVANANALAASYPDQEFIRPLTNKLNRDYAWKLEEIITSSAGSRSIRSDGFSETPALIERERLFARGKAPMGERLSGERDSGFFTRFDAPTEVRVMLRQEHLPYRKAPPARVLVTLNDKPIRTLTLPLPMPFLTITLPAGQQQLRFTLLQPSSDHWIYVDTQANVAGQWLSLLDEKQRRYHVATEQQELELYLPEPRWVRIDQYGEQGVSSSYNLHATAGKLHLSPPPGQSSALFRVYSLQPRTGSLPLLPYPFEREIAAADTVQPAAIHALGTHTATETLYQFSPGPELRGSAIATDGAYLGYQSRLDFDSDNAAEDDNKEEFLEAGWRHRQKLNCRSCYWRSDLFARTHTNEDIDVIGTDQWLLGSWNDSSWRWELQNALYLQTNPETDWSWQGAASAIETHDINEKLQHEYEIKLFGRYFSADDPDYPVDNDIYTPYQDQHRYGMKLGTTLRGRPWLDSLWSAGADLASNEDFNPLQPDYLQATMAWRQYWQPLAFSLGFRQRYYFDDDDRDDDPSRSQIALAVNSLQAIHTSQILQWGARLDYDIDRDEFAFALTLSWDYARGRGLRDFYPWDTSFYNLRNRDLNAETYQPAMIRRQAHDEDDDAEIPLRN